MDNLITISYSILTHNETDSLDRLLDSLDKHIEEYDEIVIVDDNSTNQQTLDILEKYKSKRKNVYVYKNSLNNDFSQQKNFANSKCNKEYIFNIDSDELLSDTMFRTIREIISLNKEVDVYKVPRINKVSGLTLKHIEKWGWNISKLPAEVSEKELDINGEELKLLKLYNLVLSEKDGVFTYFDPIINYPDFQYRLYKNKPEIKWVNHVHEVVLGYKTFSHLPTEKNYCLLHYKEIARQETQNNYYDTFTRK